MQFRTPGKSLVYHNVMLCDLAAGAMCTRMLHMSAMRSQVIRLSPAHSRNPPDYLIVTISLSYLSFILP